MKTSVKLTVAERPSTVIPGVTVKLFDRDTNSADDLLGTAVTDSKGVAHFEFSSKSYLDKSDQPAREAAPDLYVVVQDAKGNAVLTTRETAIENKLRSSMTVGVSRKLIAKHRLYPSKKRPSSDEQKQEWIDGWTKRFDDKDPGRIPKAKVDLCLTRIVADVLAGLYEPRTELQMSAARELKGASEAHLKKVSQLGSDLVQLIDSAKLGTGKGCSSEIPPEKLWALLSGEGGQLHNLSQALLEVEPPPLKDLPPVGAGKVNKHPYEGWDPKCVELFKAGILTGPGRAEMQAYYHEPNDLYVIDPPHVSKVSVYDAGFQHRVREVEMSDRIVKLWLFDPRDGLVTETWPTDVPSGDPNYLVDHQDPRTGRQVLAVDVHAGQTVTITGAGFSSPKPKLAVLFADWEEIAADTQIPVALKPGPFSLASDWAESLEVHGSGHYGDDKIVFDWPSEGLKPGLYQMQLEFENDTGLKVFTQARQKSGACTLGLTDELVSEVLYFAVLPAIVPRTIKVSASKVECLDLTNPEFWPDDVALLGALQFSRVEYKATDTTASLDVQDQKTDTWDKGHRVMWEGESFTPGDPNILADGQIRHQLDFGENFLEVLTLSMTSSEIEGDFDRELGKFICKAILVVLGVLATAAVVGFAIFLLSVVLSIGAAVLVVAVIVAILVPAVSWGAVGVVAGVDGAVVAAMIGIIATITAALIGAIWAAVVACFPIVDSGIAALVDRQDAIASATLVMSGPELAVRMSNVLFHRKIYRFVHQVSGGVQVTTVAGPQGFQETYEGSALGGTYKMTLDLTP